MATFYIQLADELLKINGDVTRENIIKALGYTPSSFSGEFDDLINNPLAENEDGEFSIIDRDGNIIAKVDGRGVHSVDFEASGHKLTEKSDVKYVDDAIDYLTEEIIDNELVIANAITDLDDRLSDIEHDFSIEVDYRNVINVPIVEDNGSEFHIVDTNGYKIATFSEDGLETTKVVAKTIETVSGSNLDVVRVKVDSIENLINADNNEVINKLSEVINYFSGVSESETAMKVIDDITVLSGNVNTILQEVSANTENIDAISGQVTTNTNNINTLLGNVVSLSGVVEINTTDIATISGQVDTLAADIVNFSGAVISEFAKNEETIATALTDLNTKVSAVSGNVMTLSGAVEVLEEEVSINAANIESISGALSTLASSEAFDEINKKIADNELVIAAAITDIDDRLSDIEQDFSLEVDHDEVINSPLTSEDGDDKLHIADTNGYKIATFSTDGLKATKIVADVIETTSGSSLDNLAQRIKDIEEGAADNSHLLVLSGYVETLIHDVSANTVSIDAVSGAVETNIANIEANSANIQAISGQVEALSTEIDNLSGAVLTAFAENEETFATALTDLNSRMNAVSGNVETLSASVVSISERNYLSADTKYAASDEIGGAALSVVGKVEFKSGETKNFSSSEYNGAEDVSIIIPTKLSHLTNDLGLEEIYATKEEVIDDELVTANALTNLDARIRDIEHDFSIDVDYRNVINVPIVEDNGNEFNIADTNGYKIATFSSEGLETTKVVANTIETTSGSNLDIVRVKVDNIETLINANGDDVINKLTEIINYFSGVSESETAMKVIDDINLLSSTTIAISGTVETILKENEEVIATTLTDLENKISVVSGAVEANIANIEANATDIVNLSGAVLTAFAENEETFATALTDLNGRMNAVSGNLESLSASVISDINVISARVETLSATVQDNVKDIESISGALSTLASSEAFNEINKKIADNELVIAAAITDIDDRLCDIEQDFSIEVDHDEVINSPLTSEDGDSEFHIADTNGYKIATFSLEGLETTKVVANTIETASGCNLDVLAQRIKDIEESGADNSNLLILSGYVETLIQDVSANTVNIDAVSGAVETNIADIKAISGQVEALSTEIDNLSGAVITAFAENEETIASTLNDLNSRMNTVSGTVETLNDNVKTNTLDIESISGALSTLVSSEAFNEMNQRITNNENSIKTVSGVVFTLSATVVTNERNFNSLSASVVNEIEENEETIALACTSLYKKMEMIEEQHTLYPLIETKDDAAFHISDFNGCVIATFASGGLSTTKVMAKDGFFQTSDETLKDFIGDVNVDFEQLKSIPKKYYTWKDDNEQNRQIGTSAQKVKEVYPELVTTNELTGKLSVDYAKLSVLSLKAIDMLHEENQMLKRELQEIKEKLGLK